MEFKLDAEINELLPRLTDEEFEQLRQNILVSEHIDPLVVLVIGGAERVLGDGYNRHTICEGEGIPFTTRNVEVADRKAAIDWVIANQLGRRNLTAERRSYFRGKEYLNTKKPTGNPQLAQNELIGKAPGNTAKTLAEKHDVSEATIKRDADFAKAVDELGQADPEKKRKILSGQSGLTKQEIADKKKKKREHLAAPSGDVDQFGVPVPNSCREALFDPFWSEAIEILEEASESLRMSWLIDEIAKRKDNCRFIRTQDCQDGINNAIVYCDQVADHLRAFRPAAVCPDCKGAKCGQCRHSGLVPVMGCLACGGKKCEDCHDRGYVHAKACSKCKGLSAVHRGQCCDECGDFGVVPIKDSPLTMSESLGADPAETNEAMKKMAA